MSKKEKVQKEKKVRDYSIIVGILQLFVIASIAYSSAVIVMGTEGYIPMALLVPQVVYAVVVLIKRFTK
jgi:hypothetical protein